jgi:ATP-dependent DNA helicase RecG
MIYLDTEIKKLSKIGAKFSKQFENLGVKNVRDLLYFFPFRYEDFSQTEKISDLSKGQSANIIGIIELIQNKKSPRKRINITEALISDETESIKAIWFNQPFIARNLKVGDKISLSGKISEDYGGFMINSPAYEKISPEGQIHTQGMVPIYHSTSKITQKQIRFLIKLAINAADMLEEWLPEEIIESEKFLSLSDAVRKIHFPKNSKDFEQAKKRLSFNELFLIQLQSQFAKKENQKLKSIPVKFFKKDTKTFVDKLPFKLTDAQRKAAWEIIQDMGKPNPMSRLLEGDVGSGKTLVAVLAMLNCALSGKQSALMAPTEILAKQHFNSICKLLKFFPIKIGLITASEKKFHPDLKEQATKKPDSAKISENADIIIGTQALIQKNIKFKNLALAIIDEQHRFGVEQRKKLIEISDKKNIMPHLLTMTATPIPRSLALALYGDLDLSIINQMPLGRKKIITKLVSEANRQKAYDFIRQMIKSGRQVFVICPLIDFSDKLGVKSVKEEFKKLNELVFPDLPIGFLHGKMKAEEKNKTMEDFLKNSAKILVSTSVIEVGMDVPNASVIMIEGADRFGLAQLHQFRGRVGRSDHQSYCFLFSDSENEKTKERLASMEKYNDGFILAKIDLKFRGPGEIYGTAQKGFPELKIASLFDYELMKSAQKHAQSFFEKLENLDNWPKLNKKLEEISKKVHLE